MADETIINGDSAFINGDVSPSINGSRGNAELILDGFVQQDIVTFDLTSTASVTAFIAKYGGSYSCPTVFNAFDSNDELVEYAINAIPNYKSIGYPTSPSLENLFTSGTFRTFSAWDTVDATCTKDQVGVDGAANGASTVSDSDGTQYRECVELITIPADTNWNTVGLFFAKDNDETRFPEFQINIGATAQKTQINTKTGATNDRVNDGESYCFDAGDFWFLIIRLEGDGADTTAQIFLYPAVTTVFGSTEVSATGSCIVDFAQFMTNSRICPVHAVGGGVTSGLQDLHFPVKGLLQSSKGYIYIEYEALPEWDSSINDSVIFANGDCEIRAEALTNGVSFNDGTNDTTGPAGIPSGLNKVVISWSGTNVTVTANGTSNTGTYAENFADNATCYIGRNSSGSVFPGYIATVKMSLSSISQDAAEAMTAGGV
jgi:hypothetical protein